MFIGVDIGGSHVGLGLVSNSVCIASSTIPIPDSRDIEPEDLVNIIITRAKVLLESKKVDISKVKGIGIGCPGQIHSNVVYAASNFPRLIGCQLARLVSNKMNLVPTCIINDADAAISSEVWGNPDVYGRYKNIVMITLGTGIGFSMILNGSLYQGSNGLIEGGHMVVPHAHTLPNSKTCGCGQVGCVEIYASAINAGKRLSELDKSTGKTATGRELFQRYALGDQNAILTVEETAEHLALMCINICRVVDPQVIVFGGGLSKAGDPLLDAIKKHITLKTWTILPTDVQLKISISENSGILGAALAAKKYIKTESASSPEPNQLETHQSDSISKINTFILGLSTALLVKFLFDTYLGGSRSFSLPSINMEEYRASDLLHAEAEALFKKIESPKYGEILSKWWNNKISK